MKVTLPSESSLPLDAASSSVDSSMLDRTISCTVLLGQGCWDRAAHARSPPQRLCGVFLGAALPASLASRAATSSRLASGCSGQTERLLTPMPLEARAQPSCAASPPFHASWPACGGTPPSWLPARRACPPAYCRRGVRLAASLPLPAVPVATECSAAQRSALTVAVSMSSRRIKSYHAAGLATFGNCVLRAQRGW